MTSPPPYSSSSSSSSSASSLPADDKKYYYSTSANPPAYKAKVTLTRAASSASREVNRIWGRAVGRGRESAPSIWGHARGSQQEQQQPSGWGKVVDSKHTVPSPWGRGVGGNAPSRQWWKNAEENSAKRGTTNVWGATTVVRPGW